MAAAVVGDEGVAQGGQRLGPLDEIDRQRRNGDIAGFAKLGFERNAVARVQVGEQFGESLRVAAVSSEVAVVLGFEVQRNIGVGLRLERNDAFALRRARSCSARQISEMKDP